MTSIENPTLKNVENGEIIKIVKSPFTIGRGLSSDYMIKSRIVSRTHCTLEKTTKGWVLLDSSTNGTMVNEDLYKAEKSDILKNNDEICLGFHTYTYKFLINTEIFPNSHVKRFKAGETHTSSRNGSSSSSNSPFDENGISDDLLNNLADDILVNVEDSSKESNKIDREPKNIKESQLTLQTSENNNLEQPLPLPTVSNNQEDSVMSPKVSDEQSQSVYHYNTIADPVQLILQPTQSNSSTISQSENPSPSEDRHNINQITEIINEIGEQKEALNQLPIGNDTYVNENYSEKSKSNLSILANKNPSIISNVSKNLDSILQNIYNSGESSSSSSTLTYSLPEELFFKSPSLEEEKHIGLNTKINNRPLTESASKNLTATKSNLTCTRSSNNNKKSGIVKTPDITDPVERFNKHFVQTVDEVIKKYTVELDSIVFEPQSTSDISTASTSTALKSKRSNISTKTCTSTKKSHARRTRSTAQAKSSVTQSNSPNKYFSSTASVVSSSNLNKKMKVMFTSSESPHSSTSSSQSNKKGKIKQSPVIKFSMDELQQILGPQSNINESIKTPVTSKGDNSSTQNRAFLIRPDNNHELNSVIPNDSAVLAPEQIHGAFVGNNTFAMHDLNARKCLSLNHTVTMQNAIVNVTNTPDHLTNTALRLPDASTSVSNTVPIDSRIGSPQSVTGESIGSDRFAQLLETNNTLVLDNEALPVTSYEVQTTTTTDTQSPSTSKGSDKGEPNKRQNQVQNQYEEMENELMCAICANLFIKAITLGCSHSFCQYCIEEWKKKKNECPICRKKITSSIRTLVLDNIIEKMLESAPLNERKQRVEAVEERNQIEAENAAKQNTNSKGKRGRRRGNGRERSATPIPPPIINLVDSPSTTDTDDSSMNNSYESEYLDDEWYNGRPGAYFGGYGRCYNCGDQGHWANGCPYR